MVRISKTWHLNRWLDIHELEGLLLPAEMIEFGFISLYRAGAYANGDRYSRKNIMSFSNTCLKGYNNLCQPVFREVVKARPVLAGDFESAAMPVRG